MKKWFLLYLTICLLFVPYLPVAFFSSTPASSVQQGSTEGIQVQKEDTKTYRYRSGRRSYNPAPNYNAPVRTAPRYQAPVRRTGGFFGGMGGFFAGAFLGSMLFSPFFGGYGHFSLLGLVIDLVVIFFLFKLFRRIFRKTQKY